MRRPIVLAPLILLLLTASYLAWPIASAVQIREAMRSGDVETLNRKVDWDSVRASLKASVAPETLVRLSEDPEAPKRSWWQSIKAAVAPKLADTVIDRYVTPEQLPVFLGYRETYKGTIRPALGLKDPPTVLKDTPLAGTGIDKGLSFWKRVRRAVIVSPFRMLLEVEDQFTHGRSYTATMELRGLQWQLTQISISWL